VGQPDRIEQLSDEFFQKVRRGYLEIARAEPERVKVVDASGSEDQVAESIWTEINGLLS
jgi:dTMP kinase